jgi:hypothetical protein
MLIKEITIRHELSRSEAPDDITTILKSYGWKHLGTGFEASVFEHPKCSYVLKIYLKSSLYTLFVSQVQKHNNIHFPKFLSADKKIPGAPNWRCIRMEKLSPLTKEQVLNFYLPEMYFMVEKLLQLGIKRGLAGFNKDLVKIAYEQFGLNWSPFVPDQGKIWKFLNKPSNEWQEAVGVVASLAKEIGEYSLDIHDGNLMLRDKTLVIIDPIA